MSAQARAPAGGCEVGGLVYDGGQFLPGDDREPQPRREHPEAVARRESREAQAARDREVSRHVGTVGARLRDIELTVRVAIVLSIGNYGPVVLTIAEDSAGNVITYRGGSELGCAGDRLTLSATVAEHSERDGVKQTRIARPKITAETRLPSGQRVVSAGFSSPWS